MDVLSNFFVLVLLLTCLCLIALLPLIYLIFALFFKWSPFRPGSGRNRQDRYPPEEYYIQNQVVLAGSEAIVNAAVNQIRGVTLIRLERLEFNLLGEAIQNCPDLPPDLVVDLYRIGGTKPSVMEAIERLNRTEAGRGGGLTAEPNWLAGHPWEPEGSPWEPEGSPWEPEGSPNPGNPPRKHALDAQPGWFMEQWAFKQIELAARPTRLTGAGVLVGIFDTSPFPLSNGDHAVEQQVSWVMQPAPLTLKVSHPHFSAAWQPSMALHADVRNHGLFATGLLHALAPGAELHLVRVLENDNRGDTFTLLRELFNFLKTNAASGSGWLGIVINLSLGIRVPPKEAGFPLPAEVRSLRYLMQASRCLGAMVIAAAGNESQPDAALPANLPAAWEEVLGVAASTVQPGRACFSNRGDLAAPGGDGARGCQPATGDCDGPACAYALVGPALEEAPHTGFIFWSGSSFSAPLVSGLAALVLQAGGGSYTPQDVVQILCCGATQTGDPDLGAGVINVAKTLENCLRSMPQTYEQA